MMEEFKKDKKTNPDLYYLGWHDLKKAFYVSKNLSRWILGVSAKQAAKSETLSGCWLEDETLFFSKYCMSGFVEEESSYAMDAHEYNASILSSRVNEKIKELENAKKSPHSWKKFLNKLKR